LFLYRLEHDNVDFIAINLISLELVNSKMEFILNAPKQYKKIMM